MRNFEERKAEVFRRSENRIKKRKRNRNRIIMCYIPLFVYIIVFSATAMPEMLHTCKVNNSSDTIKSYWEGGCSTGVVATDKNCPIIVEKNLLTFDILEFPTIEFPTSNYDNADEHSSYSTKVTAEYTFYNPTDYPVTTKLVFPLGNPPEYANNYNDEASKNDVITNDISKYSILVNGEPIEKTLRHSFFNNSNQFNAIEDVSLLCDGFVSDSFFTPDMTVTKYQYKISGIDMEKYPTARVAMDIGLFNGKTKVMFWEPHGMRIQDDGISRVFISVDNDDVITLFIFGDQSYAIPEWRFYEDSGVRNQEEIEGTATLIPKGVETMTFKEFALTSYKSKSAISESDWYNATVAILNRNKNDTAFIDFSGRDLDLSDSLMGWYEYEINIAAGESITNTVESPIYPAIDLNYNPDIFKYQYLLSTVKSWKSYGTLEIVVNTPYFITESNIEGFAKSDKGYIMNFDEFPDGELEFTMSTAKKTEKLKNGISNHIPIETSVYFSIIIGAILFVCGSITAFVIVRKSRNT